MRLLKINRLLPIYINIVPLKFGVDIPSQSKVRARKPKKNQYGRQVAILKVTSLKIYRLLPMATINMHMKFEIEIPKQTWLMLRKPCRLQTDGQTDGQGESSIPPPPTSLGGGTTLGGGIKIGRTVKQSSDLKTSSIPSLCNGLTSWTDRSCFSWPIISRRTANRAE